LTSCRNPPGNAGKSAVSMLENPQKRGLENSLEKKIENLPEKNCDNSAANKYKIRRHIFRDKSGRA
jgi:hypothetical protein